MRCLLALTLFAGCSGPVCSPYYDHRFFDQFPGSSAYRVHPSEVTPLGVRVDASGLNVSLADIDRQIDEIEACLTTTFGPTPYIPPELQAALECDSETFFMPLRRSDLVVKIAADYVWSCDGKTQLIPGGAGGDADCLEKGRVPTPECPCLWRAGIQANKYIVVTPDLYLLKDPVIRMVSGCNSIWREPLDACAVPL